MAENIDYNKVARAYVANVKKVGVGSLAGTTKIRYGLNDAIKQIHDVRKIFKVFAFSIDAKGDHLNQLYGKNWILTDSSDLTDLGEKLVKFCRLVSKEFFR